MNLGLMKRVGQLVNGFRHKTHQYAYEDVEAEFRRHHPHADPAYLRRAYEFSDKAHEGQLRRSGDPYITHPTAVAFILASRKLDMETIAAGFLHDVVEDCHVTLTDLRREFGENLARIVDGVTKIGKVKFRDKSQAQAENYRKMILAMAQDVRVLIVKLADRCHNMKTLDHLPEAKRRRISQETMDIYAPLAHRIGMSWLKHELEELSFSYLEPEAYEKLDAELVAWNSRRANFLEQTQAALVDLLETNNVKAEVSSRVKSHYSIWRKLQRKQCGLDGLYDYYAYRIITDTVESCYKTFGLLHGRWRHMPGRIKDFIATPKPNLYQSIHTTLISDEGQRFEVQVRTAMMHRIADEGVAAHWTYKDGRLLQVGKNDFISWLRKVADDQSEVQDNEDFLESIKGQLNAKDILVFTPNSEIKTLPQGATPLDFAYLIHTEVGHTTVGAKVDGKMVPLDSELQSGSIVEILTDKKQKPREEWLRIVRSPSARAKIRTWLRAEERKRAVEMGKGFFERELKRRKFPMKTLNNALIQSKLPEFGKKKIEDFYTAIGFGSITAKNAVKPFLPESQAEINEKKALRDGRLQRAIQKFARRSDQLVTVKGHDDLLVHLGKCCNPIYGDLVEGYITKGRGIAVHRKDCKFLTQKNVNPDRKIEVSWTGRGEGQLFQVQLRVYTEERSGMIADISTAIANTDTNVLNLKAESSKNRGVFEIIIQIHHLDHLNKVFSALKRVKGLLNIERLR